MFEYKLNQNCLFQFDFDTVGSPLDIDSYVDFLDIFRRQIITDLF